MANLVLGRRAFLQTASLAAGSVILPSFLKAQVSAAAKLNLGAGTGVIVPERFVGLSYENMQLEDPTFFSAKNKGLVEQFRAISPRGVLRLGGNTSEFNWWKAKTTDTPPVRNIVLKDGSKPANYLYAITPETIHELDSFLRATGWTCIYGLNLGYGTPETDLPEAQFVFETLGPRLEYFQIGNEVDNFPQYRLRERATWNADAYLQEWLIIARAVQKAIPGAKFGLPDVAANASWLTRVAEQWNAVTDQPNVITLSHHHYWSGPPSNPNANIERLMQPDKAAEKQAALAKAAANLMKTNYRMTEGNTVYRGGKYGLSDVFAAAIWGADYLLQLMSDGYSGVNLHGGSGHAQAVSVGGTFVGEADMKDPNVPHPKPFYTPIANEGTLAGSGVNGKLNGNYLLEPVGYGMKFAAAFAGTTLLSVEFDPAGVNAKAYAARTSKGKTLIAILNKDMNQDLSVDLPSFTVEQVLTAPAMDAREAHLLTGKEAASAVRIGGGGLTVPKHTAVLLALK
jgi:hypothetical protein